MLHAKHILSKDDLHAVTEAIRAAERKSSGEIRVEIRQRRHRKERALSIEQIARREFVSLGMTKTKGRTGILIFLLLEDRKFQILADQGIHEKVDDSVWAELANHMSKHFAHGEFRRGLVRTVEAVGDLLAQHFPRSSADRNELPDDVKIS
ncbi:MAG: TPM domain-containing protein [Ignavibacteriales bacterium]|nr:TPM domain-containing protein [Ignavibacteriales bacterium]